MKTITESKITLHLHVAVVKLHNVQMFDNNDYTCTLSINKNKEELPPCILVTKQTPVTNIYRNALNEVKGTDFEQLQYLYSSLPFLSPLICYSHVVLGT